MSFDLGGQLCYIDPCVLSSLAIISLRKRVDCFAKFNFAFMPGSVIICFLVSEFF